MQHQLNIGNFAQPCLATISPEAPAKVALSFMQKAGIRYLPVQEGNKVVGLISDNCLRAALALRRVGRLSKRFSVSDLMIKKPTVVTPETSLYEVLDGTPDAAHGFTIVQNSAGDVTGVFTPNDAISAFQSLLLKDRNQTKQMAVA